MLRCKRPSQNVRWSEDWAVGNRDRAGFAPNSAIRVMYSVTTPCIPKMEVLLVVLSYTDYIGCWPVATAPRIRQNPGVRESPTRWEVTERRPRLRFLLRRQRQGEHIRLREPPPCHGYILLVDGVTTRAVSSERVSAFV